MNVTTDADPLVVLAALGLDINFSRHRNAAATPSFLAFVANIIAKNKPETIVELGSGLSTVVVAACLKANGQGRLISFDHKEYYAAKTDEHLRRNHLEDWAKVCIAPLCEHSIQGESRMWYDYQSHLSDVQRIDLLIVDGPPGKTCRLARYPALPLLWDRLGEGAKIVLDDAKRSDERMIVDRWKTEFGVEAELIRHRRGTCLLRVTETIK